MGKFVDLTGNKYNRLTVLKYDGKSKWLCKCDCGTIKIIEGNNLKKGITKSCGCFQKERASIANTKHGMQRTRLYRIWSHMKGRCLNQTDKKYKNYGARGIKICKEWISDFKIFYNWSVTNGYKDNLTIDRIDVNGNYEPDNCRWATNKEQENNRTNNHMISYNGETKTLAQMSEKYNIPYSTLRYRISYANWTIQKALTEPIRPY